MEDIDACTVQCSKRASWWLPVCFLKLLIYKKISFNTNPIYFPNQIVCLKDKAACFHCLHWSLDGSVIRSKKMKFAEFKYY